MILTVTPNPALDVTYEIEGEFEVGRQHRVREVHTRAGGKGINVARVLLALGEPVLAMGFSGGSSGEALTTCLASAGVENSLVLELPDVRRTLVVRDSTGSTTSLWEPGQPPGDAARAANALRRRVRPQLAAALSVAVCGSVPPGVDAELPAKVAADARRDGVPVVVDADGEALVAAAAGRDAVLMPNSDELTVLGVDRPKTAAEAAQSARELVAKHGLPGLVATVGANGMAVAWQGGAAWASPAAPIAGNPTGAGDAACAAILRGLAYTATPNWPAMLADAVALSAAAVLRPVAGEVDVAAYTRWRPQVRVEAA